MVGYSRRDVIRGALMAFGVGISGCLGATKTRSIGQSVNLGGVSVAVSRVVVSDRVEIGNTGFSPMLGRVFIAPVIRIDNASESVVSLPNPDSGVSVRYKYFEANYGPFYRVQNDMRFGGDLFPSYANAYSRRNGELGPNQSVWGIGSPHELPQDFDRSQTVIRIQGSGAQYDWSLG